MLGPVFEKVGANQIIRINITIDAARKHRVKHLPKSIYITNVYKQKKQAETTCFFYKHTAPRHLRLIRLRRV